MEAPVGVLVVDDSAVIRDVITRGIGADPAIKVVGAAANGEAALSLLAALAPDVILLDVEMPVMDGMTALPKILAARPGVSVIMASALTRRHAGMSLRAIELGAADYVPKADASVANAAPAFLEELRLKIKAHGRRRRNVQTARPAPAAFGAARASALAIASSTGGPPALLRIFKRAKGAVRVPVFITQHMPASFTAMLAEQLGQVSGAPAFEGADGMSVKAGCIYVAPGGKHMLIERAQSGAVLRLSDGAPENFCKPAADPMLRSLAGVYGAGLMACVLTDMGRDGADGCVAVAKAGGRFFVQDEASSVVWGMPGAAFKTGRAMGQLSLEDAADYLAQAMRGGQ